MQAKLWLMSAVVATVPAMALAQAPPTPATPPARTAPPNPDRATQQRNCAPTQAMPSEGSIAPSDRPNGQSSEALGDKLAKSDGVLCPPAGVDPEMHAPAPNTGTMPVIPPPGSPGGDPNVRPK
ncbi:MAG: hypothetical protein J0G28_13930 [Afipia sp.]|nr:hypothetical protein [Afipia sp.]OJW61510.1 MAG: hypothetical protein BGO65_10950 [Afipia sp. 64-13]